MAFRVGQKVVCVEEPMGACCGRMEPNKNDIGTISDIYWSELDNCAVLELQEFPAPSCSHCGRGWCSSSFRPLVEYKTDISIFTALLNPANHKELVE